MPTQKAFEAGIQKKLLLRSTWDFLIVLVAGSMLKEGLKSLISGDDITRDKCLQLESRKIKKASRKNGTP